ncbi:MAG: helix-turn-helix domain-containing protein [Nocardioides sp.]
MTKRYDQYCPMAHALDLVGDRWSLLVVRELMRGPRRYTDLVDGLPGIGTNVLAARLRDLESHGIVNRTTLPPPAASRVYELTEYGRDLRSAMRELARWGARSLGPPSAAPQLFVGWLGNAMDVALAPQAPPGRFEFRVGSEVASLVDGEVRDGPIESPDVVVEADPDAIYDMFIERRIDRVEVAGDRALLVRLIESAPPRVEVPVPG